MKKYISILMVFVMVLSMFPIRTFAAETADGFADIPAVTEPTDPETEAPTEEPLQVDGTSGRVCEDGCILDGETEHLENGGECFVWISCTATEGCEGAEGHEGACYGIAAYAEGSTITVSGSSYRSKYVVISDGTTDGLYYVNSRGVVENTDGTQATFASGTYTIYYGSFSGWNSSFASGTATVSNTSTNVSVSLRSASIGSNTAYATRMRYATALYYNTTSFNHVDLRVAATYDINIGSQVYTATVYNPSVVVKVGSRQVASKSWSGTTSYEWRQDGLTLTKSSIITVELTLDLQYTDSKGKSHMLEDIRVTYDNVNDVPKFIDAIAICDMVWGLDFQVTVEDIEEEIQYNAVSYEWKVYNTDGTYTSLPAGAPTPPDATGGHEAGSRYTYDTNFVTGTSFYDYDNGLLYTFHGWDTYSHSAAYHPIASAGYYELDDGDTNAANNPTVEITADTYIYGYWTVTELEPAAAHISIEKVILVDGVEMTLAAAEELWFSIDTGIDRDGDGDTQVDVDYHMIRAAGEYKIPVYQYEKPFVFTENSADIPGYTRTTTISVSGSYIESSNVSGDSVTVAMQPVYQGENVHLGTVTYTNSYTKNVGQPIRVYPNLALLKSAADSRLAQVGVEFTLYSDAACTAALTTVTTGDGGLVNVNFRTIEGIAAGTYYLKETGPLSGYHADPCVYTITLAEEKTVEELRGGDYVSVTYYGLSVTLPEGSKAAHESGSTRLHIFDEPILGSLELSKEISGMETAHQSKLRALVIVHGPIARDDQGSITDIGATWQLELNSENGWADSLENLPLGEYLIHESFASVHGYTWTGVTYGNLETVVYNGITSGVFRVEDETAISLVLTNNYEKWTAADFYIKKVDEKGVALPGAVFTLSTDQAGANVIDTGTTGADGYTHFSGYTVPEGQTSVTYYLRETKAPAGYYLSDQVYKVVITAVTDPETDKVSFEPEITLVMGRSNGFDIATDLLTVTNYPVLGHLTITKTFENGVIPEGLAGVSVQIGGPEGSIRIVELNNENGWSVTVEDLMLGQYTITELDANVPGYAWAVSYSSATVTLTEENPGRTVFGTEISADATITNGYTRNEEIYEVPTSLTVKKVGEEGEALAGAVFTLDRLGSDGKTVISSQSFTTGAEGVVVFDLLSGMIVNGEAAEGTYILSETKAPVGYEATDATWTVTIREDDGEIRWTLNENKNRFEGFWDWILGNVSVGTFENGVLTVRNIRSRGSLTVTKTVHDTEGLYADAVYTFTLDCDDDTFDQTFTLKAGESTTIENIPWGTGYTLTEDTTGAAFTASISDEGNGRIWAYETHIRVTNTYDYGTHRNPLSLMKVDKDENTKVISGAGFTLYADERLSDQVGEEVFSDENGRLYLPIANAGTYYLAETTTPAGYHPNGSIYQVIAWEQTVVLNPGTADAVTETQMHIRIPGLTGTTENGIDYTYRIENTAIKNLVVTVEKLWEDGDYYGRPETVEVTLYRNNEAFETITLDDSNNWRYTWTDLTDEYTWSVDETQIPAEYVKTVVNQGNDWTITNTRTPNPVEVTVTKAWNHNGNKELPQSVAVTLYKDGEAYDTVTLNEENSWTYTWSDLTDASRWSVDETDVPAGYTREVAVNGYVFAITNTRTINPVEISVNKVWVASEGVIHPESVEAVLYRDGEEYDTVVLNAENRWSHIWTGLTDEFTWSVDEKTVPQGYTKNVTSQDYHFTITNTREFTVIDISVNKIWYSTDVAHPGSVNITLYRDGQVYDTVTLSAENDWTHTWESLTDEFLWTVDEPSVPSGYYKSVHRDGWRFTVVNTHVDNPKTGDFADVVGMGTRVTMGIAGFALCLLGLLIPRKKEYEI